MLPPQGAGSQRSPIFMCLHIYAYAICHRTTKFDVVTHGEVCFGVSHASHPKRAGFQQSPVFGILLPTVPTPYNAQRPNSVWQHIREGRVSGGHSPHCISTNALHSLSVTAEFPIVRVPVFQLLLSICYGCCGRVSLKSVSANSQCSYSHFCKCK